MQFEKRASGDFNDEVDLWLTFETVMRRVRVALDGLPGTTADGNVLMTPPNHEMTASGKTVSDARAVLEANDLSASYAFSHLTANDAETRQYLTVSFFLWLDLKRIWVDVRSESKIYTTGVASVAATYLDKVLADNVIAVPDEPDQPRGVAEQITRPRSVAARACSRFAEQRTPMVLDNLHRCSNRCRWGILHSQVRPVPLTSFGGGIGIPSDALTHGPCRHPGLSGR